MEFYLSRIIALRYSELSLRKIPYIGTRNLPCRRHDFAERTKSTDVAFLWKLFEAAG